MATMSEHEVRLRILFDTMVEGVVLIAPDGQIMEANPAAERILGLRRPEITGRNYADADWKILRPDGSPMPAEEMAGPRAMQEKRAIEDLVMGVERPDGSLIWLRTNASPLLNSRGGVDGVVGTFADVTDSKHAEDRHRAIVEGALDGFRINDMGGRLLEVNDSYCRMVGYTREELLTMSIQDIEDVETPEETARHLKQVAEQGYDRFETRHRCKDGTVIDVEISANYLDAENGQMFVFVRDVTERKLAEEALEYSERNYRMLVETIQQKVFLKDISSVYISCNSSYAEDLGIRPEDIPGSTDYDLYPGDLAEKYVTDDRRVMESGRTEKFEERYTLRGQERVVETYKTPVKDRDGNTVGLLGIFHDITERKQAEEALRESKELYDQLAEQSRTIAWEVDAAGLYTYISPIVEEITGYRPEEIVGKMHFYDLHPEEGRQAFKAAALEVFKQKASFVNLDNILAARDGHVVWVTTNGGPLMNADGTLRGYRGSDTDITARKRAEEALRQSEEENRTIVDVIPDMIFRLDSDGRYIDIKSSTEDRLAAPKEELLKKSIKDVLPSEASPSVLEAITEAIDTKEVQTVEYELAVPEGNRVFEGRISRLNENEVLVFVRDITEHKKADEALRQSEARYRFITDNTSDSIWALGPDLRMTYQSPSTERLFDYTLEEWHKIGWDDWVHPDHLDTVINLLNSFRSGQREGDASISVRVRDRYGKDLWAEISASPVRGQDGEFAGVVGITRDITERKEAEDRLVEYKTAVEQSTDGIALVDLEGNIRFVNEAWARMHGYSVGELIGRHLSIFHTREQVEQQVKPFIDILRDKGSNTGEVWHVRKNGEEFPSLMTTTLLTRADGEQFGMFGLMRDITGQKEMEKRQRDQEIAEARAEELTISRRRVIDAQESLRKDIAGLLHGTVQNRLILLGHKLAELESRPAAERTAEELAAIRLTLEALQSDHIRAISHRLFPSVLRLGVSAGLDSLVDQYRTELPIQLRISKRLRDREQTNRGLVPERVKLALYRVAEEALGNIVKHTPATKNVSVNLSLSANRVLRLTVDDDGGGTDRAASSTGIGLALISDYTAAAGGSCTVKNVPGKGTRVTAQVPLAAIDAERRQRGWPSG